MTDKFNEFDRAVIKIITNEAKGFVRYSAGNAVRHMEKAWLLQKIDPEMAVFRAITAEEEAATSLFITLKERRYENAEKIKFKSHPYKQAVEPFFQAVSKFIVNVTSLPNFPFLSKYNLTIDSKDDPRKLELHLQMVNGLMTTPIPPLHFAININGEPYTFEKELLEATTGNNKKEIINNIKTKANLRNELLYASHDGIAEAQDDITGFLSHKQKLVMLFLKIVCFIFPYKEKSLFVQQALNSFLLMMGDIEYIIEKANA